MTPTTIFPAAPRLSALSPRGGRDRELIHFVGRYGVVAIEHVMSALGVGQASAYRRVAACIDAGLLERLDLLRFEPSLLRATRAGLRYAGLGLPVAIVSPGAVDHWLRCASTAQQLAGEFGPERILTERELRLMERIEGRPIASAKLGQLPSGHPRLHRPDLVILPQSVTDASDWGTGPLACTSDALVSARAKPGPSGPRWPGALESPPDGSGRKAEQPSVYVAEQLPIVIEVELTPKSPRRLQQIIRAWRLAVGRRLIAEVHYYCESGQTRRAVERAVAETRTERFIAIDAALAR